VGLGGWVVGVGSVFFFFFLYVPCGVGVCFFFFFLFFWGDYLVCGGLASVGFFFFFFSVFVGGCVCGLVVV